ncbi:MAG: hypothetical protein NTZ24_03975 [Deltaproteobacteria bacterium]|nr:hypothetical protein [Deltaproteobacteria bacterium]
MKRLVIICQIVIIILFVIKISFLTETIQKTPIMSFLPLDHLGQAIAQTPAKTSAPAALKDVTDDGLQNERNLLVLLQQKQKELDAREGSCKAEEEKILALKKEIMEKIEALKALETQLSGKLETEKVNESKRFKDLAKVYEAIPSQKAAAMLEKLDLKTAAGITIQMKRDRAGAIWGFLPPQKATDITREIIRSSSSGAE